MNRLALAEHRPTLVITRTLNAPRALLWKMFSDPYHLARARRIAKSVALFREGKS